MVANPDQVLIFDTTLRSEEHTSELQSQSNLVCRLLLEKKKTHNDKKKLFDIWSTTKTMTAASMGMLVDYVTQICDDRVTRSLHSFQPVKPQTALDRTWH